MAASPPPPPPAHHSFMAAMRSAGDYAITCRVRSAATSFATLKSGPMPVYTYYFTHTPKYSANYHNLPTLGAFHGSEVPFVFGDAFELVTDPEKTLGKMMGCYWRNFAHTADPNGLPCEVKPPTWPAFVPGSDEATMILDVGTIKPAFGLKVEQCDGFASAP